MIAEETDGRRIIHRHVFADVVFVKDRSHRCDVLVAKAQIHPCKSRVPRLHGLDSDGALRGHHVPGKNFLCQRHGTFGTGTLARCLDGRQKDFLLHPSHVERKEAAVLNHLPRNLVFARRKFR